LIKVENICPELEHLKKNITKSHIFVENSSGIILAAVVFEYLYSKKTTDYSMAQISLIW